MKTFDWAEFTSSKIAVHCKTEQECDNFLKMAEEHGIVWGNNTHQCKQNYFKENGNDICYRIRWNNQISYDTVMYYTEGGFTILEWSDYMEFTKEDLKVGMFVEVKDLGEALVMPSKEFGNILLFGDSQFATTDGLSDEIMKVWDLPTKACNVIGFNAQSRDLIYERPTTKEMTVEEVSKALGYEVKIVKG